VRRTLAERFFAKVERQSAYPFCWYWTGARDSGGYGQIRVNGKLEMAHRVSCALAGKPLPPDKIGDHVVCRVHHCVNPDHVTPSTSRDNTLSGIGITAMAARRTHCAKGHPLEYTRPSASPPSGRYSSRRRRCLICNRVWSRDGMRKLRARDKQEVP
jgi:hypothetical protein